MTHILIVGGASFDTLHLKDRTVESAGGVGMYTAMAVHRCGVKVSMLSPRPEPCPDFLQPVARRLTEWLGPVIAPDQLPRFEISYRHGKTEYLNLFFGAATLFSPEILPADLSKYDIVHVAQKSDINMQLLLIHACRARGARLVSAGTHPGDAANHPQAVQDIIDLADCFFMNKREATAVFGSLESARTAPGKLLFVTMGAQGATVIQGETATHVPAVSTTELDPTGAGDTFCGATLAYLLHKKHPIMAARRAVALAAEMITQVGPTALLSNDPPPEPPLDKRVQLNEPRVAKVAARIALLPEAYPFPFVSPELPTVGHPQALDYFFAATLQQFSFWSVQNNRYHEPLIAAIGGSRLKGSDYLWEAYRRGLEKDPLFCSPEQQANLNREEMLQLFRADDGADPMPALDLHLEQARSYGRDMLALNLTPQRILDKALASAQPLQTFIDSLDQIGGYKEDPLRKKSSLLAMILNQRPEKFLPLRPDEEIAPVVDYHVLRSSLRMGLVDLVDDKLAAKIRERQIISPAEEWAVRFSTYRADEQLAVLSGKSMGAVDGFLFNARHHCPEMSEPQCDRCPVETVCAQRKELFQPVIRTIFY
jgi:sugar/nucleoside kinase (ribokinase family)